MRKVVMIGLGTVSAAVLGVAGIASASASVHHDSPRSNVHTATVSTAVSQAAAEKIALAAVPGSRVTETRLDSRNGATVWKVHLSTASGRTEVEVNAQTGAVRIDDDGTGTGLSTSGDDNDGDDVGEDVGDDNGVDNGIDDHGNGGTGADDHGGANGSGGHGSDDGSGHH